VERFGQAGQAVGFGQRPAGEEEVPEGPAPQRGQDEHARSQPPGRKGEPQPGLDRRRRAVTGSQRVGGLQQAPGPAGGEHLDEELSVPGAAAGLHEAGRRSSVVGGPAR